MIPPDSRSRSCAGSAYELYHHVWRVCSRRSSLRQSESTLQRHPGGHVESVAVITDIHGNLPALEASLHAIDAIGVDAAVLRRGPRRLRPASQRGVPADRGARDPDDLRQLRLRDRPRARRLRLRVRDRSTTASSGSSRSRGRSRTPTSDRRISCGRCRSICASSSVSRGSRLVHGSPRKVNEYLFEDKPAQPFERIAADAD